MLPWQQPEQLEEEGMTTREKIEWALIILGILALWPLIFLPDHAISGNIVYKIGIYAGLPIALIFVFVSRLRRFNKALHEQDPLKDDDRYE